jgi:molybdate transport system ATP-binding protein
MDLPQTTQPAPDLVAKVGVLLYDSTLEVDDLLAAAIALIRAKGMTVAGLLQRLGGRLPNGKRSMWLEDIATGRLIRLDEPRGSGATACILDPDALAQGACLLQQAVMSGADLIVVSRFGSAEAEGSGLRAEIAEAICSGAAVVIPVRLSTLPDLEGFLGGPGRMLLPSPAAIAAWAEDAILGREAVAERV